MAHITAWSTNRFKKVHISIDRGRHPSESDSESQGFCTPYSVRKHGRRFRWCWLFIIVPLAALLLIKFLTHDSTHNAYIFLGVFVTVAVILVLVCVPIAISTGYKQGPIVEYHVSATKSASPESPAAPNLSSLNSVDNCMTSTLSPLSPICLIDGAATSCRIGTPLNTNTDLLVYQCEGASPSLLPDGSSATPLDVLSDHGNEKSPLRF